MLFRIKNQLSCSRVRVINENEICRQVQADFGRLKGSICDAVRAQIIRLVAAATTISHRDKERIVMDLLTR